MKASDWLAIVAFPAGNASRVTLDILGAAAGRVLWPLEGNAFTSAVEAREHWFCECFPEQATPSKLRRFRDYRHEQQNAEQRYYRAQERP